MLYRINIKMNSIIAGNINSNTILGLFCNAYKIKNGEEELEYLLECLYNNIDELVFSDPLYVGTLDLMDNIKIYDSSTVLVDRGYNGDNELYLDKSKCIHEMDILCFTTLDEDVLVNTFKIAKLLGIGAKKSSGFGNIQSVYINKEDESKLIQGKTVKNLSSIFPSDDTTIYGDADFITRIGITSESKRQQPIIMIKSGSQLLNTNKIITGSYVYDKNTNTYINGKSILV